MHQIQSLTPPSPPSSHQAFNLSHYFLLLLFFCSCAESSAQNSPCRQSDLKLLTSSIVQLTRRRKLQPIFEEIEVAKSRYGKLNTIVMNAVMEACVHLSDIVPASRILSQAVVVLTGFPTGLGEVRRIDEAFQILESLEQGSAIGNTKLSAPLIIGDLRHANGLLAHYGYLLSEGGSAPVLIYNLLMKDKAHTSKNYNIYPDIVTYTTLLKAGMNLDLRPKPHLYLSMVLAFAIQGDYNMVKNLHKCLLPGTAGSICPAVQEEADNLLTEAALNEALLGFMKSILSPYLLPQISPGEPIKSIMMPLKEAQPLLSTVKLRRVIMRFFRDQVVPIIDDWGSCIGLLHCEDCNELNAPLMTMMRNPHPCVTSATSSGHVADLMLEKKYRMVVVIKYSNLQATAYSSSSRAVGVFTAEQLFKLKEQAFCRRL